MTMDKKKKPRVIWALEHSDVLITNKKTGLVVGLCFPTKKIAKEHCEWAGGKVIKFVEVVNG